MATKMPDEVPILEARDFCRGSYIRGRKRCLLGWWRDACGEMFGGIDKLPGVSEFAEAVAAAAKEFRANGGCTVSAINDSNPFRIVARIWNRAMAILGYVVGNPECDRRGKLKPVKRTA